MSDFTLPIDIESLTEIKNAVESGALIMAEMEQQKVEKDDLAAEMKDKFDMPKSVFNKLVKICHKANFEEEKQAADSVFGTYEKVMLGR